LAEVIGRSGAAASEGIEPSQAWKSGKIRIGRYELSLILDGQSGQVGIVRDVAADAQFQKQVEQDFRVTLARRYDSNSRMVDPRANAPDGFRYRHWVRQNAAVGHDADESDCHGPRQTDWERLL
jgi:hypothetical protein